MSKFGRIYVCLLLIFIPIDAQDFRVVNTEDGSLRGTLLISQSKRYYAFLGIPYARPPRRFELPEKPIPWNWQGEKDARQFKTACPQMNHKLNKVIGNEDCLYLNVYQPASGSGGIFGLRTYPVIVFIHGYDYQTGTGNIYGPDQFIEKEMVVVTMNYRLGVLGFLSTGEENIPGNLALHDQNMALKWIKNNINSFNGDSSRITLVGQGSGAAMVSLHMLSPLSKGLFQRSVTESGNALCDWAVDENPKQNSELYAQQLGRYLNCGSGVISPTNLLSCLKNMNVTAIIKAQDKIQGFGSFPGVWKPVVEVSRRSVGNTKESRSFLTESPKLLIQKNEVTGADLITGVNKNEGSLFYSYLLQFMANIAVDSRFVEDQLIPNFLGNLTNVYGQAVVQQIMSQYFSTINRRQPSEVIRAFTQMAGDALFVSCNDEWAKSHSKSRVISQSNSATSPKTYSYVFTYNGGRSFVDNQPGVFGISKLFDTGVSNGDELIYIWNLGILNFTRFTIFDQGVSRRMTTLWSRFANTGDPVGVALGEYKQWFDLQRNPDSYYEIGRELNERSSYRQTESRLWNINLPSISTIRPTTPFPPIDGFTNARISAQSQPYKTATWAMLAIIVALIILCVFLCCMLIASKRKREFKAEPDVYH